MRDETVVVIGAGIGGLACAIDLAAQGIPVLVVERGPRAGGKMRETEIAGIKIDSGPTVFTMRWVFDALFAATGATFDDYVTLSPLDILARHAWSGTERFDLFADTARAADAVSDFSGSDDARHFLAFCAEAESIYQTLKQPFLTSSRPGPLTLAHRVGYHRLSKLFGIRPFETLWGALSKQFRDPRLRQLFARYSTYNGSSPFAAPATLMLIAHVEQSGVWTVAGGMQRLAEALQRRATELGVAFRFDAEVKDIIVDKGAAGGIVLRSGERLSAGAVVLNADTAALADGLFGNDVRRASQKVPVNDRSLSAVTLAFIATPDGFPLLRHNVFFSDDYAAEFNDVFKRRRLPESPTVYICAQDRDGNGTPPDRPDRLLLLVNAPPTGDLYHFSAEEIAECETKILSRLAQCGLTLHQRSAATAITTPTDYHRLFPGTGGALYGRASHGWTASFRRPGSQSRIPGLYLAGGSTHPGAGVPMAALSGRLAAARLLSDHASTAKSRPAAISGGISTASATIDVPRSH